MKFTALIAACRFPDAKWLSRSGEPAEVRLCLPAHVVNVAAEQTLYIGPLADMPSPKIGACYLITDPNPVNSTDFQHYMGCDVVHTTQCAEDAHWTAAQCLSEEQWLNSAQAKMIELLFSGASLQALIDEAYNIMGNPIVVVDSSYKILAVNDALSNVRPDLARQQELGYMLETNIASMKRDQLYEKARETRYPYYSKDESTGLAWITALVYADSIEVGQIGMVEHFREFTHADFELINFLCRIIGMELQKDDFSYKNSGHMHSILMKDLLDQLISNEDAAAHRAASLGWASGDDQHVLVVYDKTDAVFDRKARIVSETLQHILPYSRWVLYDNKLVFFLPYKPDSWAQLIDYLTHNQLRASLSDTFTGLLSLRTAYIQAQRAYEIGSQLAPEERLYLYTDYIFQHMGQVLHQNGMLQAFSHPVVSRIAAYDAEHHTELLPTLRAYLQYIEQPAAAAKVLFIHKNTLFYRIGRIRELFGIDLSSGQERARLLTTIAFSDLK